MYLLKNLKGNSMTAIEWLVEQFKGKSIDIELDWNIKLIEQAKELEKKQAERMYSEEEVIELLTARCKHFGTTMTPFRELLLKQDLEWFEQNKKK
jgi:hypothetical protein